MHSAGEEASALRCEAEALSAGRTRRQRKSSAASRASVLQEVRTEGQGERARQRCITDVLNGDGLRAVAARAAYVGEGKAQGCRLRPDQFDQLVVAFVGDEDIAGPVYRRGDSLDPACHD